MAGNYIGTNLTGTAALGNAGEGVLIAEGAKSSLIGTDSDGVADDAERNLVSGNLSSGVAIVGVATELNVMAGNYIGTDVTGTLPLGNGLDGVVVDRASTTSSVEPCRAQATRSYSIREMA